jgi:nicotinamidase-related amidase
VDALIVVDMQVGLLSGAPKHDLEGVVIEEPAERDWQGHLDQTLRRRR